jgi:triosephosphate isomerase
MKFFFANWKENTNYSEAIALASSVERKMAQEKIVGRTIVLFPPSVFLVPIYQALSGSAVLLGAQDISKFEGGAHTGEISAGMVKPYAKYVLLGHSERRSGFGETSRDINQKIMVGLKEGLSPLICVSSRKQLEELDIPSSSLDIFIVYEPVEFIGGEEAQALGEITEFYEMLEKRVKAKFIYGGSVNEENSSELLKESFLDGLLIGHSSLDPERFGRIISAKTKV